MKIRSFFVAFLSGFVGLAAFAGVSLVMQGKASAEGLQSEPAAGTVWKEPTTGMEFVWIPTGDFMMASNQEPEFIGEDADEQPVHKVHISGFWMGKYEVTQGQRAAISPSDRGGMGVRLQGRDEPPAIRRSDGDRLVRGYFRRNDASGGSEEAECLWTVRHVRECLGVVPGSL